MIVKPYFWFPRKNYYPLTASHDVIFGNDTNNISFFIIIAFKNAMLLVCHKCSSHRLKLLVCECFTDLWHITFSNPLLGKLPACPIVCGISVCNTQTFFEIE